jgi:hypothetical protein
MKTIEISDEAYLVIMNHTMRNNESTKWAVDELIGGGANKVWNMDMPETRDVWTNFMNYYRTLPSFEDMLGEGVE